MKYLIRRLTEETKTPEARGVILAVSEEWQRILDKTKIELDCAEKPSLDVDDHDAGRHIGQIQGIKKILNILEGKA